MNNNLIEELTGQIEDLRTYAHNQRDNSIYSKYMNNLERAENDEYYKGMIVAYTEILDLIEKIGDK
jgi:hypothetical protein